MFQASIYIEVGNGHKTLFWSDPWLDGKSIADLAPCLCATVGARVKKQRTVAQALQLNQWTRDIAGALPVQVIMDYLYIWSMIREVQLEEGRPDKICWKWTSDKNFSTASAYKALFLGQHPVEGTRLLQKMGAPAKCKFFIG